MLEIIKQNLGFAVGFAEMALIFIVLIKMILGKLTDKKEIKEIICYSYYILAINCFCQTKNNPVFPAIIFWGISTPIVIEYLILLWKKSSYKEKIKYSMIILSFMILGITYSEIEKSFKIIVVIIDILLLIMNLTFFLTVILYHLYINNIKSKLIYLNIIISGASLSFLLADDDLRNEKFLIYLVIVIVVTKIFRKISDNIKIGMYLVPYIMYLILKVSKLDISKLDIDYIILLIPLIPLILMIIGIKKEGKKATVKELDIITMVYFIFYSFWEVIDSAL